MLLMMKHWELTKQLTTNCQLDSRRWVSSCLLLLLALCVGSVESERNGAMQRSSSVLRSNSLFLFVSSACLLCSTHRTSKTNCTRLFSFFCQAVWSSRWMFSCLVLCFYMGFSRLAARTYFLPLSLQLHRWGNGGGGGRVRSFCLYRWGPSPCPRLASRFPVFVSLVVGTSAEFLKHSKFPWLNDASQEWHAMMSSRKKADVAIV